MSRAASREGVAKPDGCRYRYGPGRTQSPHRDADVALISFELHSAWWRLRVAGYWLCGFNGSLERIGQ